MALMKRDVNLGLLLIIVAALLMFSGFTVYYQTTFKNLSNTYKNQLTELDKVSKDLEAKRSQLNTTSVQLQLNTQKEADLSVKFTDIRGERDQLATDKNKLTADLTSTKSTLAQTQANLAQTQSDLAAQVTLVGQLSAQVLNLKADVQRFTDLYNSYKNKYDCVASKVDANGNAC